MGEIMLKVSRLSKQYRLGQIGGTTLREELQRRSAKRRNLEDPTSKIGAEDTEYGKTFMALDDISFEVRKGERVGIIGRNGAGKSTLLKLISRITAPSEGDIWMDGRVASMLEVGTGFHGELTGRENIYMNGAILGMKKKEIDAKIEDIIEFSECRQFIDTPVKRYSSGMYVKLAFSVAAHLDSEIMIMDEVLAVGDMAFQKKCLEKMSDVSKAEGKTILYVSHNMNTIRQLCERCIVLDHGKLVFDGDVEKGIDIYSESKFNEELSIDYSGMALPKWIRSHKIRLKTAAFLDKKDNRFGLGEKIRFRLTWENLQNIKDISVRIEIRTLNEARLGTYVLYDFCSGESGKIIEMETEFDPAMLVEGLYYMAYTFFEHDSRGNQVDIESRKGLCFEIVSSKHTGKLDWRPNLWGYLDLEGIEILSITDY